MVMYLPVIFLCVLTPVIVQITAPTEPPPLSSRQPERYVHNFHRNGTNIQIISLLTEHVCGRRGLCDKSLNNSDKLCTFECPPCRCDEVCHYYGDCCPDVLFENSPDRPPPSSPYVSCSIEKWTKWVEESHILMVSRCPESNRYTFDIVRKCENPDIKFQEEATPVSNQISQITYQNKFCAMCHGDTVYRSWRHNVTCDTGSVLTGATSKEDLWRTVLKHKGQCHVKSFPPLNITVRSCIPKPIERCNVTGKWLVADPFIETFCELYSHTVQYYGGIPNYKPYRNIFCAVCNGGQLDPEHPCMRVFSPRPSSPLSVLLAFNPSPERQIVHDVAEKKAECDNGKGLIYDPLTTGCREISCSPRRHVDGTRCKVSYSSVNGLGFRLESLFRFHDIWTLADVSELEIGQSYQNKLKEVLRNLSTSAWCGRILIKYIVPVPRPSPQLSFVENAIVLIDIILRSKSKSSIADTEKALVAFMSSDLTYSFREENFTTSSSYLSCSNPISPKVFQVTEGYFCEITGRYVFPEDFVYEEIGLDCAFVDYNLTVANFTFDNDSNSITFENFTLHLNDSEFLHCGDSLKLCVDVLSVIMKAASNVRTNTTYIRLATDPTMSLVSSVCIGLSLVCLVLTFITYSCLPSLRTLPGLNTMSVVFYLFLAQLLFLTGIDRTENQTVCNVLGGAIYFFWTSTFCWMSVSAFHMFMVFRRMRPIPQKGWVDWGRYGKYCLFCLVIPILLTGAVGSYYLIKTNGKVIGFGKDICFLNEPGAVGYFFVSPLILMLLVNAIFFFCTMLQIRSVPNMAESSNQNNKRQFLVYIKLSLLFGFTWIFGIFGSLLRSDILWYVFIVLTGSQGVFLFLAFCVNRRILDLLKTKFTEAPRASTTCDKTKKTDTDTISSSETTN